MAYDPRSQKTKPEEKGNWVFELIPVAVAGIVGAVVVNTVVGVIDVGFVGSSILGVMALVVITGALNEMAKILNENVSKQEKVDRAREQAKGSRLRVK